MLAVPDPTIPSISLPCLARCHPRLHLHDRSYLVGFFLIKSCWTVHYSRRSEHESPVGRGEIIRLEPTKRWSFIDRVSVGEGVIFEYKYNFPAFNGERNLRARSLPGSVPATQPFSRVKRMSVLGHEINRRRRPNF